MAEGNERDKLIAERLQETELKMMMAVYTAKTEGEITAIDAALSSSLGQSVRLRCEEIEVPIGRVRQSVNRFFLMQGGTIE